MEFIDKNTIELDKIINKLDEFVIDFVRVLDDMEIKYVIIAGYVSILLGRSRATEDVDLFIERISKEKFKELYEKLSDDYWCLNSDDTGEVYEYLNDGLGVRFALKEKVIPNMEIKFAIKPLQKDAFNECIKVITKKGNIIISSLERQIAFKRYFLKSDKDLEDARHIEKVFDNIDKDKIDYYRRLIENEKA